MILFSGKESFGKEIHKSTFDKSKVETRRLNRNRLEFEKKVKSSYFIGRHGIELITDESLGMNFRKVHLPRDLERILAALVLAWRILSCGFFFGLFSDDLLFEFGFSLDRLGLADPPFPALLFPEILKSEFIDKVANSSAKSIFPSDFRFSPLKYFSAPAAISIELPLLLPVRQFVFPVVLYPVGLLIHPLSSD